MALTALPTSTLHIERIAQPQPAWPFPPVATRMSNALRRAVERATVAGAVRALETGDRAAFARYMARGRDAYRRFSMPSAMQMEGALSGTQLAPAPGIHCSTWLEHDAKSETSILVYVHGGSFIAERSPRLTALIARVAKAAGLRTLIVDYRLAPEHPCPAAVDDVEHAILDLIAQGYAPGRIGVVAESAGAAIALSAVQRLRDAGQVLGAMCFLSPWTDLAMTGRSASARAVTGDSASSMEAMAICVHFYLQGRSPLDPMASPVYGELGGLPPMLVHTSRTDGLHDDACALAQKVHAAGSEATLRIWSGGSHVFERLFDQQSERAIADAGSFLRRRLA